MSSLDERNSSHGQLQFRYPPAVHTTDFKQMEQRNVILDKYDYMKDPDNAAAVYDLVSNGRMPGGPWSKENIERFKAWIDGGYAR